MPALTPDQWQSVSPYLDQALAMDEGDRAAWLVSLRQQDPALAAQVGVLLDEASVKAGGEGAFLLPLLLVRRSTVECEDHRSDEAAADAARALRLLQTEVQPGTFSSKFGYAYLALGQALQAQGKTDEARAAFRSAAEHLQNALGLDHPDTRTARQLAGAEGQRP